MFQQAFPVDRKNKVINATLLASGWVTANDITTQDVTVAGVTTTSNGIIGLPTSATAEQREAARVALLAPTAQSTNSLTITVDGDVPEIDIPIEVVIY